MSVTAAPSLPAEPKRIVVLSARGKTPKEGTP